MSRLGYGKVTLLAVLLWCRLGHADRVEQLCRTLAHDSSQRVRVQAALVLGKLRDSRARTSLIEALDDSAAAVRAVAAKVLGELGGEDARRALEQHAQDKDAFVRESVASALHRAVPGGTRPSSGGAIHVEIGNMGSKTRLPPELMSKMHDILSNELDHSTGFTSRGESSSGFVVDGSIVNVSHQERGGWLEVSCNVSLIVGRLPTHAIVMMTSSGAIVQAPRSTRGDALRPFELEALDAASRNAYGNVVAFLKKLN